MTTTAEPETIPIDAWCVALVETDHYYIKPEDAPHILEIRAVYLFDRNLHVHCCEFTPSYHLIHLYDQVITADGTPDELRERLDSDYAYCGGEDRYVHCRSINRLIANGDGPAACHLGKPVCRSGKPIPPDEMDYDEIMEDLRETYCGNPPL